MVTATPVHDLLVIEKLREQELEEARIIQSAMLPSHPLHEFDLIISHEFQPIEEFGVERVQELCCSCYANTPLVLLEHLFTALDEFTGACRQWDDITATVFHYAVAKRATVPPFYLTLFPFSRNKGR